MSWPEEDWLQLSGLQHFAFCRRQWALIHIENQWAENYRTVDGHLMYERVHDQEFRESRGDRLTVRGLAIHPAQLGVSGQCDAAEFFKDPAAGRQSLLRPSCGGRFKTVCPRCTSCIKGAIRQRSSRPRPATPVL